MRLIEVPLQHLQPIHCGDKNTGERMKIATCFHLYQVLSKVKYLNSIQS